MPKVFHVKKARKPIKDSGIKVGDSYYWWKFNFSRTKHVSKTYPKRSQLTQSGYLSQLYEIEDRLSSLSSDGLPEDLKSEVEDIISELTNLKDECESSLENIPDQLRDGNAGTTLQERIDSLDSAISELEGIDLDYEEDEDLSDSEKEEKLQEWLYDKVSELANVGLE